MSTKERIVSFASKNEELLRALAETDYAPSALHQVSAYINDVESQIATETRNISTLARKVDQELHDHEKYRDSRMKRLAYKMGGQKEKFEAKAEKEEREYHDALQEKFHAEKRLEDLKARLADAKTTQAQHADAAARHQSHQAELQALYRSLFDGPTPEFPDEDAAENAVEQARQRYNNVQGPLNVESQVLQMLADADRKMNAAHRAIQDALRASQADMFGFGGAFADMQERSSLSQAQSNADQVQMLVDMARRAQPLVEPIGRMEIAQGNFMSDVLFDNFFADMSFHRKIEQAGVSLKMAHDNLRRQLGAAQARAESLKVEARGAEEDLQRARNHLDRVRQDIFRRVGA
jgi:uncharacterized coiled-coil protein SlyX